VVIYGFGTIHHKINTQLFCHGLNGPGLLLPFSYIRATPAMTCKLSPLKLIWRSNCKKIEVQNWNSTPAMISIQTSILRWTHCPSPRRTHQLPLSQDRCRHFAPPSAPPAAVAPAARSSPALGVATRGAALAARRRALPASAPRPRRATSRRGPGGTAVWCSVRTVQELRPGLPAFLSFSSPLFPSHHIKYAKKKHMFGV
jgi:hypothetical protein